MAEKQLHESIYTLRRGGYIVDTSLGYIQFSSPPETIKDSMVLPGEVPQYYVLPENFFNWIKGISVAEVEFPIYFNFFIKKRKTHIICNAGQVERFKVVLNEALFGPKNLDLKTDFDYTNKALHIPDLQKELKYFRNNMQLSHLVEFEIMENKTITLDQITITINSDDNFEVLDRGKKIVVPGQISYKPKYDIGQRLKEPFDPPLFGVTCLGPSYGFDPKDNTSGFIIWLNRKGIMIDPPVNSTEWLQDSNVNPKLIDSIILTHCHADHDAGTFQKILEEGKIKVYTTKTILDSFLLKYGALTDTGTDYLSSLFGYSQVKIGIPEYIHAGKFEFFYSLHSIPTIGFRLEFEDKSFVYSSDHNNDPQVQKKLLETGVITRERYDEFRNFPWHSDVIYHESGIAPLHTPIAVLDALDDEIKKKIVVYHIAAKDVPEDTLLTRAKFGIEHTLYFDVNSPEFEKFYQILGVLGYIDFFGDMPISKAQEFVSIVEEEHFNKGDYIIRKGTVGDRFYIIYSGNVAVITEDLKQKKIYGACDSFGEVALVTNKKRTADVVAATDVVLFTIEKSKFLSFIKNTEFEKTLLNLAAIRNSESWNLLSTSPFFRILTSTQKTTLESMLHKANPVEAGTLIKEGQNMDKIYILRSGEVEVKKGGKKCALLDRGDFIGSMVKLYNNEVAAYTFDVTSPVQLFSIYKEDVVRFLDINPGLKMKLVYDF